MLEVKETLANLVQPFDFMTKIFPGTFWEVQSMGLIPLSTVILKNHICCHEQIYFEQTELLCLHK